MAIINWTNVTNIVSIGAAANTSFDGTFWVGLLFAIWIIFLLMMSSFAGWEIGLLISSFATMVLGIFFVYLGYVQWYYGAIFLGMLIASILVMAFNTSKTNS